VCKGSHFGDDTEIVYSNSSITTIVARQNTIEDNTLGIVRFGVSLVSFNDMQQHILVEGLKEGEGVRRPGLPILDPPKHIPGVCLAKTEP
jgi:hypothetical protein